MIINHVCEIDNFYIGEPQILDFHVSVLRFSKLQIGVGHCYQEDVYIINFVFQTIIMLGCSQTDDKTRLLQARLAKIMRERYDMSTESIESHLAFSSIDYWVRVCLSNVASLASEF